MAYVEVGAIGAHQVDALRLLARTVDLNPGSGASRMTPLGSAMSECARIVGPLATGLHTAQFIILLPSQQIVLHTDPPVRGRRLHIPVETNAGCWALHGGTWSQLEAGHCYEMDPTIAHGAVNWGASTRLQLILDLC